MIYDAYNLVEGKTYKFMVRYNLEKKVSDKYPYYYDDKMPYYYIGTYIGRKYSYDGKRCKYIWIFKNFINHKTKNFIEKIEIKHFGIMKPSIEEFIDLVYNETNNKSTN